ncbi:UDP-N-acetylmuramoyl-L-alanine--D-glutamate ligase [Alteribacillus iranensis]|uniref:UDP-N-acetylmuramoylalanine--D-glutamate ligase n=1 Tax=Alteribacillus iranensis TaxID=930128 RepID=A0A1I2AAP7_9BACI|nr:UDP-N-acetylmuramoyl-L-alanine--D-glutamate ligase [Alteribacillus iranensis]SFE40946.1 UDP-N-acetylmuramoylalanine--D-glutamate ligase [Alteribacillus iranensis]
MKGIDWLTGKQVLVLGLAKSGFAAAKLLKKIGAKVIVNDAKNLEGTKVEKELTELGINLVSGDHPLSLLDHAEYIVKNPGIPYSNPITKEALSRGIPVVTEIELAGFICKGELIAISGSNGKTTTTRLIHAILKESMKGETGAPHLAGNIGNVACDIAQEVHENDIMVTEVSSFQLKGTERFHPRTSVLLNIFDAHLDYHGTREDYEKSKGKLFTNLTSKDHAVYNVEDPVVKGLAEESDAALIPFSVSGMTRSGAYVSNHSFYFKGEEIIPVHEVMLPGKHNHENILAAIAASILHGADIAAIRKVLREFSGIEHRLQYIGSRYGRKVYNDSKATNILSTQKAIEAFHAPTVLIAGGLDRGNSFDELIPSLSKVKAAVFYGETKNKLVQAATQAGVLNIKTADTLEKAVPLAFEETDPSDILLLSPACASWDQFKTFEERGEAFVEIINHLKDPNA